MADLAARVNRLLGDRGPSFAVLAVGRGGVGTPGIRHGSVPGFVTTHEVEVDLDVDARFGPGVAVTAYALATTVDGELVVIGRGGLWNRPQAAVLFAPIADCALAHRWARGGRDAQVLWHLTYPDGRWNIFVGPAHGYEVAIETFVRAFGDRATELPALG